MSYFIRKHEFTRSARLGPSADIQSIGSSLQSQRVWTVEGAETKWLTLCLQDLRIRSCFLCLGNGPESNSLAEILIFSWKYQSIEILVLCNTVIWICDTHFIRFLGSHWKLHKHIQWHVNTIIFFPAFQLPLYPTPNPFSPLSPLHAAHMCLTRELKGGKVYISTSLRRTHGRGCGFGSTGQINIKQAEPKQVAG